MTFDRRTDKNAEDEGYPLFLLLEKNILCSIGLHLWPHMAYM